LLGVGKSWWELEGLGWHGKELEIVGRSWKEQDVWKSYPKEQAISWVPVGGK